MKNINIDFKILGEHFVGNRNLKSVIEQMRKLKRKHEATGKGLWTVYVKAYNFDIGEAKSKSCENCEYFEADVYRPDRMKLDGNCLTLFVNIDKDSYCSKHEPKIIKA